MQGSVFLQFGQGNAVIGTGRIVGQVGKTGDHWLIEYFGKPVYRRVFPLAALENFAIFATIEDRDLFLNPPKKAAPVAETTPVDVEAAEKLTDPEAPAEVAAG